MKMGNVIVGQSGGPTAVINSSLAGAFVASKQRGARKIYGMLHGIEGFIAGKYIDLHEHFCSELDVELLKRTPSAYLGSCRYKLPRPEENEDIYKTIFSRLKELDIKSFFYIGGNDSMDTIKKLSDYAKIIGSDIRFMGVPKTIDNDLAVTDHTPGFGSAAKYIASITKEIIRDGLVYDKKSVTLIEVMGRNAGWLTASAALARTEDCEGPDLIFVPEIPFSIEAFTERVNSLQQKKKSIVVAVSEGIKLADGRYVCELENARTALDPFGHKSLTGSARFLSDHLAGAVGCKTRAIEFSTLQRCASHIVSRTDITEAFQVGGSAVKAAYEGESAKMIVLVRTSNDPYIVTTKPHDIDEIANIEKLVPREWLTDDEDLVSREFLTYCKPLIQAELTPVMVDGLPMHLYHSIKL